MSLAKLLREKEDRSFPDRFASLLPVKLKLKAKYDDLPQKSTNRR